MKWNSRGKTQSKENFKFFINCVNVENMQEIAWWSRLQEKGTVSYDHQRSIIMATKQKTTWEVTYVDSFLF